MKAFPRMSVFFARRRLLSRLEEGGGLRGKGGLGDGGASRNEYASDEKRIPVGGAGTWMGMRGLDQVKFAKKKRVLAQKSKNQKRRVLSGPRNTEKEGGQTSSKSRFMVVPSFANKKPVPKTTDAWFGAVGRWQCNGNTTYSILERGGLAEREFENQQHESNIELQNEGWL